MNKWNERLDKLKERLDAKNETELARALGVSQQALNQVRNGADPGAMLKFSILDKLGFTSLRDAVLEIFPEEQKKRAKKRLNDATKATNRRTKS